MSSVLIIEDDAAIRQGLSSFLAEAGHSVDSVASGMDGVQRVAEEAFDVIVLDLEMPENVEKTLMEDLEKEFKDYYTVSLKNYPVEDAYLPNSQPVKLQWRS